MKKVQNGEGSIYNLSELYLYVYIEYTFLHLSISQKSAVLAYHSEKNPNLTEILTLQNKTQNLSE